jgi:hypothetical protein
MTARDDRLSLFRRLYRFFAGKLAKPRIDHHLPTAEDIRRARELAEEHGWDHLIDKPIPKP